MNENSDSAYDLAAFVRAWLRAPLKVGAIAPSGSALAKAITKEISPATGPVLELGPGTGVFTRALLDRGIAEENLTLLERDPRFAKLLRERFPGVRIVSGCATELRQLELFDNGAAGAIVSGLPLLSMKPDTVARILYGAFSKLCSDGALYQFTYRPTCPVPKPVMKKLDLHAACIGFSFRNLPPAWVFSIRRRTPDRFVPTPKRAASLDVFRI
ncbi:MAG TPA: rRNA adenine N-6-methyltransferase family protein [Chthoniobacterales bacterium]